MGRWQVQLRTPMSEGGFSLVETLIGMIILLFVLIAILHLVVFYTKVNLENAKREVAVKMAQSYASKVRVSGNCTSISENVTIPVRNFNATFEVKRSWDNASKICDITVEYGCLGSSKCKVHLVVGL